MSEASTYKPLSGGHGGSNSRGGDDKDKRNKILNDVKVDIKNGSELHLCKYISLYKPLDPTRQQYLIETEAMAPERASTRSSKKREASSIVKKLIIRGIEFMISSQAVDGEELVLLLLHMSLVVSVTHSAELEDLKLEQE